MGIESAYEKRSTLPAKFPPVFGHFRMYRIYKLTGVDCLGLLEALLQSYGILILYLPKFTQLMIMPHGQNNSFETARLEFLLCMQH